jgi:hypothetical protein
MVFLLLLLSTKLGSNCSADSMQATTGFSIVHSPGQTRHVPQFETALRKCGSSAVTWRMYHNTWWALDWPASRGGRHGVARLRLRRLAEVLEEFAEIRVERSEAT